jgi:Ca-activated chloride channel homolog
MRLLSFAAVLLISAPVGAQSAVLVGTVTEGSPDRPVQDVVVTASSPSLQGERTATTGADGRYGFPGLPPGQYNLSFEKAGFHTFYRGGISLRMDGTFRVDMELARSDVEGCFIGSATPPSLEAASTSTGVRIAPSALQMLPLPSP